MLKIPVISSYQYMDPASQARRSFTQELTMHGVQGMVTKAYAGEGQ